MNHKLSIVLLAGALAVHGVGLEDVAHVASGKALKRLGNRWRVVLLLGDQSGAGRTEAEQQEANDKEETSGHSEPPGILRFAG